MMSENRGAGPDPAGPGGAGALAPLPDDVSGGARALLFGLGFLQRRRDLWPLALVPVGLAFVLGLGAGCGGAWLAYRGVLRAFHESGGLGGLLVWLLALLAGGLGGLVGLLLGSSLAVPFASPALERIALAARAQLGLPPPAAGLRANFDAFLSSLATTLVVLIVGGLGVGALGLLLFFVAPAAIIGVPLKLALLALLLTLDLSDQAFTLSGRSLEQRVAWIRAHRAQALGFGGLGLLLLGVPVLGLLVLPAAVAGAVRLTAEDHAQALR